MTTPRAAAPLTRTRYASGAVGAVAAAHPLAVSAGLRILERGGSAVDAAISAQAVVCVLQPQAAGIGGDMLALVHEAGHVTAVNGTGLSPRRWSGMAITGGGSVTVPGLVDGWATAHHRWGRLPMGDVIADAIALAREGSEIETHVARAVDAQRQRLLAGGALSWDLLKLAPGAKWRQPRLAELLELIADSGAQAFYRGAAATAISAAVARTGGFLDEEDLLSHTTPTPAALDVPWEGGRLFVQPPASQGILLAMALRFLEAHPQLLDLAQHDHLLVELTGAVFEHRDACHRGARLLNEDLEVDVDRAGTKAGARGYLHTAGVATVDAHGQVVSSLISVFDDFGSGVFVPELGVVLNNRAAGFTEGENAGAPSKRPVHTLAPALLVSASGEPLAMATPGADGQVQTLLQVLTRATNDPPSELLRTIDSPRWRSQGEELMIEPGHPAAADLLARGHNVAVGDAGADIFGAIVAAGVSDGQAFALADWRRQTTAGAI